MKYYKLFMDTERENDVICHYKKDFDIPQNVFCVGKKLEQWDGKFEFYYDIQEGNVWTDYLANDKGWFVVSEKLKILLQGINTEIQFFSVKIKEKNSYEIREDYYIANIIKVVDALCLEKSKYFETFIEGIGTIYTVSKYGIYEKRTENADIFKLAQRQEIPIFVSEKFKQLSDNNRITGIYLQEINVSQE